MAPICPYCKQTIDGPDLRKCPSCSVPHHPECWVENRGCAVFGCSEAPYDQPQLAVSSGSAVGSPPLHTAASQESALPYRPAKRTIYMLLGLFLGAFGMHNFYAGRIVRAMGQLLISCLTLLYALPVSALWAWGDVCFVTKDGKGRRMI